MFQDKLNKEGDKYAKKERAIVEHSLNSKLTKLKKQLQEVSKKVDSNVLDISTLKILSKSFKEPEEILITFSPTINFDASNECSNTILQH